MSNTFNQVHNNFNWYRLIHLLNQGVRPALLGVLHNDIGDRNYTGMPHDPAKLYHELGTTHRPQIDKMLNHKKKLLSKGQYDLLLPSNKRTCSAKFDITLIVSCIRNFLQLPSITNKWDYDQLDSAELQYTKAYVIRARDYRNEVLHANANSIDQVKFQKLWREGHLIIKGLNHTCDINSLRNEPLDDTLFEYVTKTAQMEKDIDQLSQCLKKIDSDVADHDKRIEELEKKIEENGEALETLKEHYEKKIEEHDKKLKEHDKMLKELKKHGEKHEYGPTREMEILVLRGLSYLTFEYEFDSTNEKIIREEVKDNNGKKADAHDCSTTKVNVKKRRVDCPVNGTYKILVEVEHKDDNCKYIKNGSKDVEINDFQGLVSSKSPIRMLMHGRLNEIPNVLKENVYVRDLEGTQHCMTIKEWNNKCEIIYKCYFDGIDMTKDYDKASNLFLRLKEQVKRYNPFSFYSLFVNYNPLRHLNDLVEEGSIAIEKIGIDCSAESKDSTILCDPESNSVFYIQSLDTAKDFRLNLEVLWYDMMLFASLHQNIARNEDMEFNLFGLLFTDNYTKDNLRDIMNFCCTECHDLCLTKDILNSEKSFSDWWSVYILPKITSFNKNKCEQPEKQERLCRKISSRIAGSLSKENKDLCNPFDSTFNRLQKLQLTPDQEDVIKSNPDHLVITGNFGSGKTIVLRKMLQKLCGQCSIGSSILYLSGDPVTVLVQEMMDFVEDYKRTKECPTNLRIIGFNDASNDKMMDQEKHINLFIMTMSEFIQFKNVTTENKLFGIIDNISGENDHHLFIDELNGEEFTENVALSMKKLLDNDIMKGKKIILATQAIKKERKVSEGIKEDVINQGYKYDDTGMMVKKLTFCMRNVGSIYNVLKCAAKLLENYQTKFICRLPEKERTSEKDEELEPSYTLPRAKEENEETINEKENDMKENAKSINVTYTEEEQPSQPSSNKEEAQEKEVDLTVDDHELKSIELTSHPTSGRQLKSSFRLLASTSGTGIDGEKVRLVKPFPGGMDKNTSCVNFCHLHEAMRSFKCLQDGTIVTCFDKHEKALFEEIFKMSKQKYFVYCPALMNTNEGRDVFYKALKNKSGVFLTDYRGVRGLEVDKAVVIISTKENFLAPYFSEAFTRAICSLSLIYFNWSDQDTSSYATLLVDELNEKRLVSTHVIKECGNEEECVPTNRILIPKETGGEEEILICHHDHNRWFREYYESKNFEIDKEVSCESNLEKYFKLIHTADIDRLVNYEQDVEKDTIEVEEVTKVDDKEAMDSLDGTGGSAWISKRPIHKIHQKLMSYAIIGKKLLEKVLESASEDYCYKRQSTIQPNQSFFSVVLSENLNLLKQGRVDNPINKERVFDVLGNVLLAPDIKTFDIIFLLGLIRNVPENKCLNLKAKRCNIKCDSCEVKKSMEFIRAIQNCLSHVTDEEFANFEDCLKPLPDFPYYVSWDDLKMDILKCLVIILNFIADKHNFKITGDAITRQEEKVLLVQMEMITYLPAAESFTI